MFYKKNGVCVEKCIVELWCYSTLMRDKQKKKIGRGEIPTELLWTYLWKGMYMHLEALLHMLHPIGQKTTIRQLKKTPLNVC